MSDYSKVPAELKTLHQWVCWNKNKVPINAHTGDFAKTNDKNTWASFDEAVSHSKKNPQVKGIGFVFTKDDPFIGIDLDHCVRPDGTIANWAQGQINFIGSYAERSPNDGVHIIVKGSIPGALKVPIPDPQFPDLGLEIYKDGRYLTVTGNWLPTTPVEIKNDDFKCRSLLGMYGTPTATLSKIDFEVPGYLPDEEELKLVPRKSYDVAGLLAQEKIDIHKRKRGNNCYIYELRNCPWEQEHTKTSKAGDACVMAFDDGGLDFKCLHAHCDQRRWKAFKAKVLGDKPIRQFLNQNKQAVCLDYKELNVQTDNCWEGLARMNAANPVLFRENHPSGTHIILLTRRKGKIAIKNLNKPGVVRPLLDMSCRFYKTVKLDDGEDFQVDHYPPAPICENIIATREFARFPELERVITTPVFSKERRLHTVTGYDNGTKFYYVPDPELNIPELPRKVSDRHISEAFQLIEEILCDFPFVEPADKAHAIAYMLLPFCYDVINSPEKPVFLFKAPMPSTGKSLLVRILSLIYLGSELPVFSWEGSKEEMRKAITSTLMQKPSHFLIDNLNVPLRSSSLAAAVTSGFWQDRILGVSENVRLPIRCIWVITANNPILSREINSRCIPINLNAKIPFPDLRDASDFKHPDLYRFTGAHRGELVAACLTLIKAWIEAGEPEPRERKMTSRFGEWAKVTGGILEHVGISGFLDNIEKQVHAGDEESPVLEEFIYRWYAKFSETAVSTRALVEMIEEENIPIELSVHNKTKSLGQVLKGWEGYVISGGDGDVTVCRGKRRGHGNYVMNWLMLKS